MALWLSGLCACGEGASPGVDAADTAEVLADGDVADPDTSEPDAVDSEADAADTRDGHDGDDVSDVSDAADEEVEAGDVAEGGPGDFDPDHLVEVDLELPAAEWDALRSETRALFDILGPSCQAGPAPDVFHWREADVVIDGRRLERVGVRKKGFLGSLDTERPSLRIELDEYVPGQELDGLERLVLNNGRQDPGRLRQCLAYHVFRKAGVPTPRCAFAHVRVNGVDKGLYVHVEAVKKAFIREHFGVDAAAGEVWEGQLSDFRPGWLATFDPKLGDLETADTTPLEAVVTALAAPDDTLIAALDAALDLDAFFTFWAAEVLVAHWDGYAGNTNNFFVYAPPGDDRRLRFIPWGTDGTFVQQDPAASPAMLATGALAERLLRHPVGRQRFVARVRELLTSAWSEVELIDLIARWDALTFGAREAGSGEAGSNDVAALKVFVAGRRAALEAALDTLPPAGPPLREAVCAKPAGTLSVTFETRWGTLPIDNLFLTGRGTFTVTSDVLPPIVISAVGAKAGVPEDGPPGTAQIIVAGQVAGAGFLVVLLDVPRPLAPSVWPLGENAQGTVYYLTPDGAGQFIGFLGDADLVLESAGEAPGDPGNFIAGHFDATLYAF